MYPLKLVDKKECGIHLFHLTFATDPIVLSSYKTPGQALEVRDGEQKSYFALASKPHSSNVELLIKQQEGLSDQICSATVNTTFQTSQALGNGFNLAKGNGKSVHLFSMGSGIAPFRALIQSFIEGDFPAQELTLWQGSFTNQHLPFQAEYHLWQQNGVVIHECLDQTPPYRNVIEALRAETPDLTEVVAYWVGHKDFGHSVKETCFELGLPKEQLMSNF